MFLIGKIQGKGVWTRLKPKGFDRANHKHNLTQFGLFILYGKDILCVKKTFQTRFLVG